MATIFPQHARRDDPNGHMVVQQMVEFLRDEFDQELGKIIRGNSTIVAAATFADVAVSAPATYSVVVTPLNDPGSRFWVSNRTSGGFRINLSAAAPVGGVAFDWIVKGA